MRTRWPGTAIFDVPEPHPIVDVEGSPVETRPPTYRYLLTRTRPLELGEIRRRFCYVMLNPSSAGAHRDDMTIAKLYGYTDRAGGNAFDAVNLHAFIATNPMRLGRLEAAAAIGPLNGEHVARAVGGAERVFVAWGARGNLFGQVEWFRSLIAGTGIQAWALKITREGMPAHPGRLPYAVAMVPWPQSARAEARP